MSKFHIGNRISCFISPNLHFLINTPIHSVTVKEDNTVLYEVSDDNGEVFHVPEANTFGASLEMTAEFRRLICDSNPATE